jgi:hypothetical protein
MSQFGIVRANRMQSRGVDVSVFVCLHGSCNHVTKAQGPYSLGDSRWRLSWEMTGTCGCNPAKCLLYWAMNIFKCKHNIMVGSAFHCTLYTTCSTEDHSATEANAWNVTIWYQSHVNNKLVPNDRHGYMYVYGEYGGEAPYIYEYLGTDIFT